MKHETYEINKTIRYKEDIYIKSNKMRGDKKRGGVRMSAETKTLLSGDRVRLSHGLLEYDINSCRMF